MIVGLFGDTLEEREMKTEIDKNLRLKLAPETELEGLALRLWWSSADIKFNHLGLTEMLCGSITVSYNEDGE